MARGHRILPSELNHRANIWAMKKLGVAWIISVSAVGSLQVKYKPCDIVLTDQFVDRTKRSPEHTFFGRGIVAHIAFADPICAELRHIAAAKLPTSSVRRPRWRHLREHGRPGLQHARRIDHQPSAGYDVIGMTNLGEASAPAKRRSLTPHGDGHRLRLLEGRRSHVTVEMVIENLHLNAANAKQVIATALPMIPEPDLAHSPSAAQRHLDRQESLVSQAKRMLRPLLSKYL